MAEPASLKDVIAFFKLDGERALDVGKEFKEMDDESKEQIKRGIGDGSLTY